MASAQQLKSRIGDLESALQDLRRQLREAEIAESSVKVGEVYVREVKRYNRPPKIERGQVVGFRQARWSRETRPVLKLFKKDGTLGTRESEVSDYSDWKPEALPPNVG